jgi:hypothetical protein
MLLGEKDAGRTMFRIYANETGAFSLEDQNKVQKWKTIET